MTADVDIAQGCRGVKRAQMPLPEQIEQDAPLRLDVAASHEDILG
jgi:hypothetical protein